MTMAKEKSKQKGNTTTTLESLWKTQAEDTYDEDNMEIEEKEQAKTSKNSQNTPKAHDSKQNDDNDTCRFSMNIRFTIVGSTQKESHIKHLEVLKRIKDNVGYLAIYNKDNEKTTLETTAITEFDYHQPKNKNQFIVVHKVIMDKKYHTIKQDKKIIEQLKLSKCFIQLHAWETKDWDIITVGFLSGISTKNQSKITVMHKIEQKVEICNHYWLRANTFSFKHEQKEYTTKAYEIQCKRSEATNLCVDLSKASKIFDFTLIKYKWKYTRPQLFINGIKKQNDYIMNIRTIPVYGITKSAMSFIEPKLMEHVEILDIGTTSTTNSLGRWNIYTNYKHFEKMTKWLEQNLQHLHKTECKDILDETPTDFHPQVRFSTTVVFDNSLDTLADEAELSINKYISSTKSWASIVGTSTTTSTITTQSPSPTSPAIVNITESLQKINDRLDRIEQKLAQHQKDIDNIKQTESTTAITMERILKLISNLEDRTDKITPRKLDDDYDSHPPSKRPNLQSTPTKRNKDS